MASVGTVALYADRWTPFVQTITFTGIDLTGATLRAQIRLAPDTPGTSLVDLMGGVSSGAEGLHFAGVQTVGGVPVSTVVMRVNEPSMEGLPAASEVGDDVTLAWDMHITIGGLKQKRLAGPFTVRAGVTQA